MWDVWKMLKYFENSMDLTDYEWYGYNDTTVDVMPLSKKELAIIRKESR